MTNEYAKKFYDEKVIANLPDCHGVFVITTAAGIDTVKHPIGMQYNTNMNPLVLREVLSNILKNIEQKIEREE